MAPIMWPKLRAIVAAVSLSLLAAACSSNSAGSSSSGSTAGSASKSPIVLGAVVDLTGGAASAFSVAKGAIDARVALANAHGGINGHPITMIVEDSATDPNQVLTAAKDLVLGKRVVGMVCMSGAIAGAVPFLVQEKMPCVGSANAPQFGDPSAPNLYAFNGRPGAKYAAYTSYGNYFKQQGATNIAVFSIGASPSGVFDAKAVAASAKATGIKVGFEDLNIGFTQTDFTADALAMKRAGINGLYAPLDEAKAAGLMTAVKNEGLQLKAPLLESGYGQDTLDNPQAVKALDGATFQSVTVPVELNTPGTKAVQSALAKYDHFTGVPSLGQQFGWLNTDILLKGIALATAGGKAATPASINTALEGLKGYDSNGYNAGPVDYTTFNNADALAGGSSCWYAVNLNGTTFTPVPKTAICGTKIPGSEQNPAGVG